MGKPMPNEEERAAFVALLAERKSRATAAGSLGYLQGSFETLMKQDPDFAEQVIGAEQQALGSLEDTLLETAHGGNVTALLASLKALNPSKWGDKTQHTHTGPGGGPIQVAGAVTFALREVLTDPTTRPEALALAREIPPIEATAVEVD